MLDVVLSHLKFMSRLDPAILIREVDTLLREAINETIGLDAFSKRFASELQHAHSSMNAKLLDTFICLLEILLNANTNDMMPYLARYQVVHHAISAVMDSRLGNMTSLVETWPVLFLIFR